MKKLLPLALIASFWSCTVPPPQPDPGALRGLDRSETSVGALPVEGLERLTIGIAPVYDEETLHQMFRPLVEYLSDGLGVPIELEVPGSYLEAERAVLDGSLDIVQLTPLAYVTIKDHVPQLRLLVSTIAQGASSYSGYILTRPGLPAQTVLDLKGTSFGFIDTRSASGYLYPYAFLLSRGVNPRTDFKSTAFFGRHDALLEALLENRVDAGATYSDALLDAKRKGLRVEELGIFAKTGRIPNDAWCARPGLPRVVGDRVRELLLAISTHDRRGRFVLGEHVQINAFTLARESSYDQVRRVLRLVQRETESDELQEPKPDQATRAGSSTR